MSFKDFQFHQAIQRGIEALGFKTPTPIQQQSIQPMLDGKDILGLAQTGTGKTAAFVLPMLQNLVEGPRNKTRALIMAPTRELAQQIHDNICIMGRNTGLRSVVVYGGVGKQPQLKALRTGTEIVVACPGRLLDLLSDKGINLSSVELLVLDEADHMFDKGFLPDMRRIIKQVPKSRQSVIFSATMPMAIETLTAEILVKPVRITVDHRKPAPSIEHTFVSLANTEKSHFLQTLLREKNMTRALVFTRTKHKAKSLAISLQKKGFRAVSMQGNLSQQKRQQALDGFQQGTFAILVATDIAARGIDVQEISHVINYDFPDTIEAYTHRTGRTGRAQHSGKAVTFIGNEDKRLVAAIRNKFAMGNNEAQRPATGSEARNIGSIERLKPRKQRAKKSSTGSPGKRQAAKSNRAVAYDFGLRA
jgi:superfamily II DNA/RNA helicase